MPSLKNPVGDAFDNEDEDIQTYGSTIESAPLKPKRPVIRDDSVVVKIEEKNKFRDNKILDCLRIPDDAISKDSDSLINDAFHVEKYDPKKGWWKHPKVKSNWKIVVAAFVLLMIGIGLLITGIIVEVIPNKAGYKGLVLFIAGAICFIPGAYHVVYVYCAVKGRRGFDFNHLPLFN